MTDWNPEATATEAGIAHETNGAESPNGAPLTVSRGTSGLPLGSDALVAEELAALSDAATTEAAIDTAEAESTTAEANGATAELEHDMAQAQDDLATAEDAMVASDAGDAEEAPFA